MAVREIIKLPDKRLRLVSEPVKRVDAGIRKLVEDMFESQYDAPGIGLAAIQVGVAKRVVTVDLSKKEEAHEPRVFINPEITWTSEEKATYGEGCLSIPEVCEEVERPVQVKVKYLDLDGKAREIEADGVFARCLRHEIDHINGVLFIDHLSKLKRDRVIKKFSKAAKKKVEAVIADPRIGPRKSVWGTASNALNGHRTAPPQTLPLLVTREALISVPGSRTGGTCQNRNTKP